MCVCVCVCVCVRYSTLRKAMQLSGCPFGRQYRPFIFDLGSDHLSQGPLPVCSPMGPSALGLKDYMTLRRVDGLHTILGRLWDMDGYGICP